MSELTREQIVDKMTEIRKQYGDFGSIPLNSDYWGLRNQLQALDSLPKTEPEPEPIFEVRDVSPRTHRSHK